MIDLNEPGHRPDGKCLAWFLASLLLMCVCGSADVLAHETKLSSTRMSIGGGDISAQVELNAVDLNVATGRQLTAADGKVDAELLAKQLDAVQGYVAEHVKLGKEDGPQCTPEWTSAMPKDDHVVLGQRWNCPDDAELVYRVTLFHEIDPASRHMVSVDGDRKFIGLLSVQAPQMALAESAPSKWQTVQRYVVSGIEHIAIGYDHIAFLLAVIVLGRRFWPLVKVVTAFTVAHSITLTFAVLGIVTLPSALVEALIAASIVYVAAENFFVRDIRHRWWLTFAFGLIHGFGFASVLRDYGLPDDALGWALASFNIGVEIGQLLIVAIAVVIWQVGFRIASEAGFARTERNERRVSLVISGAVLVPGLYWLGQRLLGF
jgi:hydrogenase/urease accessory protein HupE